MQVINKKSHLITAFKGKQNKEFRIRIETSRMALSQSICIANRFRAGQFLHFMNDGALWYFFVDDDPNGFKLVKVERSRGSLELFSSAAVHLIRQATKSSATMCYPIEETKMEMSEHRVFKIRLDKPCPPRKSNRKNKKGNTTKR